MAQRKDPRLAAYEAAEASWEEINSLAGRAAKAMGAPRKSGIFVTTSTEWRTREVPHGFLGLFTRTERYSVEQKTEKRVCPDYWSLSTSYWERSRSVNGRQTHEEEETNYCLGADGSLFMRFDNTLYGYRAGAVYKEPSISAFSSFGLEHFDFETRTHEGESDGAQILNTGIRAERLRPGVTRPGDGLIKVLRSLGG